MAAEQSMVERVARAIEEARCHGREGPYGLYDYTSYGAQKPHKVRDFRKLGDQGDVVFESEDPCAAEDQFDRLTEEHIARAAIEAMREPSEAMVIARMAYNEGTPEPKLVDGYRAMIDAALADVPAPSSQHDDAGVAK